MEYRTLGRAGLRVSAIGLGTEHMERRPENQAAILDMAVEAGVNYIDLLYLDPLGADAAFWQGFGPPLRRHRDKLVLAAHWGGASHPEMNHCRRVFPELLASLGSGYAELGLMTMIDDEATWQGWAQQSLEELRRFQAEGRIGHIAMSTHVASVALKAVQSGLIDVLMVSTNMLDHADERKKALHAACVAQGVGLVVMKAYHGGTLLCHNGRPTGITPAQCLAYVLAQPGVATTVPGPKTVDEWRATLRCLEAREEEMDFGPVLGSLGERFAGQCVYCHHCLPCPEGIEIGWAIWFVDQTRGRDRAEVKKEYDGFGTRASGCTECGTCLERCPFGVDIPARLRQAVELFERSAG